MLFHTPTAIAALFATVSIAIQCNPGTVRYDPDTCVVCPDGWISTVTSPDGDELGYDCEGCPPGQTSDPSHTGCVDCSPGWYSRYPGGCRGCEAGSFNNVFGATTCWQCSPGMFSSTEGATSCCTCCAGFYSDFQGMGCTQCPSDRPYSNPGSSQISDCVSWQDRTNEPNPVSSCTMEADNVCPEITSNRPVGSPVPRKKRNAQCSKGFEACPRYSGRGGFDCVNTENDPTSCGGCVGLDGDGTGTDCTAIKGASTTRCVSRSCVIDSCRKGWIKSIDGTSCLLVSHINPSSHSADLHVQDTEAKRKMASSAKRAIRAKIL